MTDANAGRRRVGVLISGSGSNLQALIDGCRPAASPARIALVIANRDDAYGLVRARESGIETTVIDHTAFDGRAPFDAEIDRVLKAHDIDLVCLAGFMRILTPEFVNAWRDRMLNIHPSLLPRYKGLNTHQRALDNGDRQHGCTVHLVRPDLDDGPMLVQAAVPVVDGDDAETLAKRVLVQEHAIYPMALNLLAAGRVRVDDDRALIDGAPGPVVLPDGATGPEL